MHLASVKCMQKTRRKLVIIEKLNAEVPVAMVGDGINDAGTCKSYYRNFPRGYTTGRTDSPGGSSWTKAFSIYRWHWAWGNIHPKPSGETCSGLLYTMLFAIPLLPWVTCNPVFAALAMGFSDVVLAINSIWLRFRKVIWWLTPVSLRFLISIRYLLFPFGINMQFANERNCLISFFKFSDWTFTRY